MVDSRKSSEESQTLSDKNDGILSDLTSNINQSQSQVTFTDKLDASRISRRIIKALVASHKWLLIVIGVVHGAILGVFLKEHFPENNVIENGTFVSGEFLGRPDSFFLAGHNTKALTKAATWWSTVAALLTLPGDVIVSFYGFIAQGILAAYMVKMIAETSLKRISRLFLAVVTTIVVINVIFLLAMFLAFKLSTATLQPLVNQELGENVVNDPALRAYLKSLPEKFHFMFPLVLDSLVRNATEWNALRLVSVKLQVHMRLSKDYYDDPTQNVHWGHEGPRFFAEFGYFPSSSFSLMMFAFLMGYAVRLAEAYAPLLKRFFLELTSIWLVISVKAFNFLPFTSSSIMLKTVLTSIPSDSSGPGYFYLIMVPCCTCAILALAMIIPTTAYLRKTESPFRDAFLYVKLIIISTLFVRSRTEFVVVISILSKRKQSKMLKTSQLTFILCMLLSQPVSGASALFLVMNYLKAFDITLGFLQYIKIFVVLLFSGLSEGNTYSKCINILAILGFIDESRSSNKPHHTFDPLTRVTNIIDIVSIVLKILLAWNSAQLVQHFGHGVIKQIWGRVMPTAEDDPRKVTRVSKRIGIGRMSVQINPGTRVKSASFFHEFPEKIQSPESEIFFRK